MNRFFSSPICSLASATLFTAVNGQVTEEMAIIATDDESGNYSPDDGHFGMSVAISNTHSHFIIVGAPYEDAINNDNTIENAGGVYIFEFDSDYMTYTQHDRLSLDILKSSEDDYFGGSVSLSGSYAIIGSVGYGIKQGAAYIFQWTGDEQWTQIQTLLGSDSSSYDRFGYDVDISGNYIIIGAYGNDNNNGIDAGAAYIFELNEETNEWNQTAILLSNNGAEADYFGKSVSIDGDYAVVGSGSCGSNSAGSAFVFKRDNDGSWNLQTTLEASDAGKLDYFGDAVSISGNYIIVGAVGYDVWNFDTDLIEYSAGAAYTFERDQDTDTWSQTSILTASDFDEYEYFGHSVSISDFGRKDIGMAVVGARKNDENGAAYFFEKDSDNNWSQTKKLVASDGSSDDSFGWSVAVNDDMAIVGTSGTQTVYYYV